MKHLGDERLTRYALGELDAEQRLEVDRHLQRCERCAARAAAEARLDEWLARSLPAGPGSTAERALERLWQAVDDAAPEPVTAGVPASAPRRWRRLRPWWPALAAAASLLALLWSVADLGPDRGPDRGPGRGPGRGPLGGEPEVRAIDPPQPSALGDPELAFAPIPSTTDPPWSVPADSVDRAGASVDPVRLAQVRDEVGALLLTAADEDTLRLALAAWRRDGWPVASLLRAHALGADDAIGRAAVWASAQDAATLAAVVQDGRRAEAVLALLERDDELLGESLVLLRAVERRAAADDDRCLGLLARTPGERAQRALERVWRGRLARLRALPADAAAAPIAALADALPADDALELLLATADVAALRAPLAASFARSVARAGEAGVERLEQVLAQHGVVPPLQEWIVEARLVELVPAMLALLERDGRQLTWVGAVAALGGEQAALGLHALWEAADERAAGVLGPALSSVLREDPAARAALVARLATQDSAETLAVAAELPADLGDTLLLEVLVARDDARDPDGHGAALLAGLARGARSELAAALLAWVQSRPPDHALVPLGWTVAARLDPLLAQGQWSLQGRDPDRLARVARAASRPLDRARPPSSRVLAPLGRDLDRVATP